MNVDFVTAIKMYFANFANFKGRSTRAEYWWAVLFVSLVSMVLSFFGKYGSGLSMLWGIVCILPTLAISVRRMHDSGLSGWVAGGFYIISYAIAAYLMYELFDIFKLAATGVTSDAAFASALLGCNIGVIGLLSALTMILGIVWIVLLCRKSGPDNQYGPNPYGE